jgi:hypothetical protein
MASGASYSEVQSGQIARAQQGQAALEGALRNFLLFSNEADRRRQAADAFSVARDRDAEDRRRFDLKLDFSNRQLEQRNQERIDDRLDRFKLRLEQLKAGGGSAKAGGTLGATAAEHNANLQEFELAASQGDPTNLLEANKTLFNPVTFNRLLMLKTDARKLLEDRHRELNIAASLFNKEQDLQGHQARNLDTLRKLSKVPALKRLFSPTIRGFERELKLGSLATAEQMAKLKPMTDAVRGRQDIMEELRPDLETGRYFVPELPWQTGGKETRATASNGSRELNVAPTRTTTRGVTNPIAIQLQQMRWARYQQLANDPENQWRGDEELKQQVLTELPTPQ